MYGKCPKCGDAVVYPNHKRLHAQANLSDPGFPMTTVHCPNVKCQTILGVMPDYHALVDDIASQVVAHLKKTR